MHLTNYLRVNYFEFCSLLKLIFLQTTVIELQWRTKIQDNFCGFSNLHEISETFYP